MTAIDCPRGVAPERMPKADATGLAPEKSADHKPPAHHSFVREVCLPLLLLAASTFMRYTAFSQRTELEPQAHFVGEVSERRPLGMKREDRPAAFAGRSESRFSSLFCYWDTARAYTGRVSYPTRALSRPPSAVRPKESEKSAGK